MPSNFKLATVWHIWHFLDSVVRFFAHCKSCIKICSPEVILLYQRGLTVDWECSECGVVGVSRRWWCRLVCTTASDITRLQSRLAPCCFVTTVHNSSPATGSVVHTSSCHSRWCSYESSDRFLFLSGLLMSCSLASKKGKGSPYLIGRVLELIPVFGSQPAES